MKRSNCVYWLCQNTFLCTRSFFESSLWVTRLEYSLEFTIQCSTTKIMHVIISPTTTLPYWGQGTFLCLSTHYQWLGSDSVNRKTNIVTLHALLHHIPLVLLFCLSNLQIFLLPHRSFLAPVTRQSFNEVMPCYSNSISSILPKFKMQLTARQHKNAVQTLCVNIKTNAMWTTRT